jgi:DNA polymerase epsilon subunit 1
MKGINKSENGQQISLGIQQPAGMNHKGDPALEFIKHVCAVLALDQHVQHEVLVICA